MNILIVGGLLILGIAAILGAIFLAISDQRKENGRLNNLKQDNEIKVSPPTSHPTIPLIYKETIPPQQMTESTVNRTGSKSTSLTDLEGVQKLPALNGQFHELAAEIRSLHQQAWQLEQRLSVLTDMVDHIEHSQNSHFDIEEEDANEEEETQQPSDNTLR